MFVGLDVSEKHLRKLPSEGYALLILLGELSVITFTNGNCGRSISFPGEMMIIRPSQIKTSGLGSGGCHPIVLYDSGTPDELDLAKPTRAFGLLNPPRTLAERWTQNERLEEAMTVDAAVAPHKDHEYEEITIDVHTGRPDAVSDHAPFDCYNLVQACCEKNNHLHRRSKINQNRHFIDITIYDDFSSAEGLKLAFDGLRGPMDTIFFAPL